MPQSAQQFNWSAPGGLLLPKLSPPRPVANLIPRERLLKQMDQALTHDLTLLSASAGFGKTTLLSTWTTRCPVPVAWLSLEEEDNDPLRFWRYVIAALQTQEPGVGETALNMVQSPQSPTLATILTSLINDLAAGQEKMVLALDDFHVIDDPDLVASFQFLLEHLPARFHLMLAGRNDPKLALARWRARGQVVELRDRDLRFTRAEVATFLRHALETPLAEAEVDLLEQRTEGWIAGLQLAALAMHTHEDSATFIQQLSGNQRFILEYLQEEVLERQSQEVQDFLLHTSVLTRLNPSLCQAVLAKGTEQESQQLLLQLEKANLFLVERDEERRWYRLHNLLRDVLQAQLRTLAPACIPVLHQRAARWYAQQGGTREAILHALAGRDYAIAADLLEMCVEHMCLNGEAVQLQLAEPADYLRIYLDAGISMRQVLHSIWQDAQPMPDADVAPSILASINTLLTAFAQQEKQLTQEERPVVEAKQTTLPSLPVPLTARECEVLPLLAQGQTNQEIADQLVISFATAKKHVANILSKLGAENRVQAVARAREYELL